MKIILISAVLLHVSCCYAYPAQGVSSYAYQDSAGNRYGGTYDQKDKVIRNSDPFTVPFNNVNSFFPDYFTNFNNILPQIFGSDFEGQRLASYAARKAYDLTYNHIGYNPNFFRFSPFSAGFPYFGQQGYPGMDPNLQSALAIAIAGPDFTHQVAAIDPINIDMPNVDLTNRFNEEVVNGNPNGVYSVSSTSIAKNIDGKGYREAETVINNNGKITKYKVHS
ncbi:unnamed protein product, partial [Brenthis ino]